MIWTNQTCYVSIDALLTPSLALPFTRIDYLITVRRPLQNATLNLIPSNTMKLLIRRIIKLCCPRYRDTTVIYHYYISPTHLGQAIVRPNSEFISYAINGNGCHSVNLFIPSLKSLNHFNVWWIIPFYFR